MLYLLNFIDYENEKNQTQIILKIDLPKDVIDETVEKIIDESKKLWNEDGEYWDGSLYDIVMEQLKKIFGKENVVEYERLEFYW